MRISDPLTRRYGPFDLSIGRRRRRLAEVREVVRSTGRPAVSRTLADVRRGESVLVTSIAMDAAPVLHRQGVLPGERVTVETHAPFGGPIVVRLGRARIAIARSLAAAVDVAPDEPAQ